MVRYRHRYVLLLIVAIWVAGAGVLLGSRFSFDDLVSEEQSWRTAIVEHPIRWWLIAFLVYFLAALVPGTRGKAVAMGWLFGFWPALALINLALTAAAQLTFLA